mgnify:CR=1 FL=1
MKREKHPLDEVIEKVEDKIKKDREEKLSSMDLRASVLTILQEIDKYGIELIDLEKLLKMDKLKKVSFNFQDITFIRRNKIKNSELICNYINFQNIKEIKDLFKLLGLDKKLNDIIQTKDNKMPHRTHTNIDFKNMKGIQKNPKYVVIEFYKDFCKHIKVLNLDKLYILLSVLLEIRHKIIHKNIKLKIKNDEVLTFTGITYEFVTIVGILTERLRGQKTKPHNS